MSNDNAHNGHTHVLPLKVYFGVTAALFTMTILTVLVTTVSLEPFNLVIAMFIAAVKATLVALYFMHLKYDNKLYSLIFIGSLAFLAVFVIITMYDTQRRGDIYEFKQSPINKDARIYREQPGAAAPADTTTASADTTLGDTSLTDTAAAGDTTGQ